jgi:hypothetical protein
VWGRKRVRGVEKEGVRERRGRREGGEWGERVGEWGSDREGGRDGEIDREGEWREMEEGKEKKKNLFLIISCSNQKKNHPLRQRKNLSSPEQIPRPSSNRIMIHVRRLSVKSPITPVTLFFLPPNPTIQKQSQTIWPNSLRMAVSAYIFTN